MYSIAESELQPQPEVVYIPQEKEPSYETPDQDNKGIEEVTTKDPAPVDKTVPPIETPSPTLLNKTVSDKSTPSYDNQRQNVSDDGKDEHTKAGVTRNPDF